MQNEQAKNIKLPRKISDIHQVEQWESDWGKADNADCSIPRDLSVAEIRDYFSIFMNRLPNEFAFTVLGEIAEYADTPWDLLTELFDKGDTSCMVSICCRPDLPDNMLRRCIDSPNRDVLEHVVFHEKVTIRECESLLQRPLEKSTVEAIQRAIAQKKGVEKGFLS